MFYAKMDQDSKEEGLLSPSCSFNRTGDGCYKHFFMKTTSPWTALGGFLFFKKKFIEYIGRRHHLINNIPSMDLDEVFISIFCDLY